MGDDQPDVESHPDEAILDRLLHAEFEIEGRMPWSSNGTFLVTFDEDADPAPRAVYKPLAGERPLWDFPAGLYKREVAAYELSNALGWNVIPPTVVRSDAELGEGSLQHFVDADFSEHHFSLVENDAHHPQLRAICAFDIMANNTDRKSGHCLIDADGHIWGIDNGLCFAVDYKLRTVIWEFSDEDIPPALLDDIDRVVDEPPAALTALLDADEIEAMRSRGRMLLTNRRFPIDRTGRGYPWPLV